MLHAFRSIGYLRKSHLKDQLGQRDKRINGFIRDGYIEKCTVFNQNTRKVEEVYRLSNKGKEMCRQHLNLDHFYRSNSANHDLQLAERYFALTEAERSTWITEVQFREIFMQKIYDLREQNDIHRAIIFSEMLKNQEISPVDGGYLTETGSIITFEIITKNYDLSEITAKEAFSQFINAEYKPQYV